MLCFYLKMMDLMREYSIFVGSFSLLMLMYLKALFKSICCEQSINKVMGHVCILLHCVIYLYCGCIVFYQRTLQRASSILFKKPKNNFFLFFFLYNSVKTKVSRLCKAGCHDLNVVEKTECWTFVISGKRKERKKA